MYVVSVFIFNWNDCSLRQKKRGLTSVLFEALKCVLCICGIAALFALSVFLFRVGHVAVRMIADEAMKSTEDDGGNK